MIIKLNFESEVPIYLQLRNEIVKGIGKGDFNQGESIPTVRQMAEVNILCSGNLELKKN